MKFKKGITNLLRDCCIVLFAFAAMFILAAIAFNTSFMNPVAQTMKDFSLTDIYYYVMNDHGRVDTSRVVTIVDMTDLTDRADIVDVLEEIENMNPKVVGVDVVFEGLKPDSMADMRVREVVSRYSNVVFSYRLNNFVNDSVGYEKDTHSFFADEFSVKEGFTNYERSLYGGIKRKITLKSICRGEKRNSLVYEVAQLYTDGQLAPHESNVVNVNFRPTVFRVVPFDSVKYHRDWIEDQIVLYGATRELYDLHYTPLGEMAGVELLAYSLQTLLEQSEVIPVDAITTAIVSFLLVLITYIGKTKYVEWAKGRKNEWVRFFLTTTFVVGFLLFLWTGFLAYCGFLIFVWTNISFSFGWTMAALPFLYGAGEFYGLTIRRVVGGFTLF